jgi:Nickel responsive protein SCO4226-like
VLLTGAVLLPARLTPWSGLDTFPATRQDAVEHRFTGRDPEILRRECPTMPLYLDVHNRVEGLTTERIVEAHKKDLAVQGKYGVSYIRYWYDEGTGKVFCLCQAPSKEAAAAVHREAHGGMADEIIEVKEGL